MTTIDRPNIQALSGALDVYRDAMRPFIVRNLKRVPRRNAEGCIKSVLRDEQYNQFVENRKNGLSIEASIDIGDFPQIMNKYKQDAFSDAFKGNRGLRDALHAIIEVRNKVAHPPDEDVDMEYALVSLDTIGNVLMGVGLQGPSQEVSSIKSKLLPFKTPAHRFIQGGRCVYAFSLDLETLDKLLPERVDDRMVRDANRPLTPSHAADIQKYLEGRRDWLLGALLLGVSASAVDFQPYTDDSNINVGELAITAEGAASLKMFDGQHRRRAIRNVMNEISHNSRSSKKLAWLKEASLPIMLYVEDDIQALRQMFADASKTRTIERNTVTRFDRRDAFNLAALYIAENSDLFIGRVEMERASVARSNPNIIAINQLAQTLKALEVGYAGRISKDRNEEYMLDIDDLYERCWLWADDFMPAARDEYNDLMAGEIDNADIPEKRAETMAYNATVIRILAGCLHKWTKEVSSDWQPLADFLRQAPLRPGVNKDSLLLDAGIVAPGGTSPIAQRQPTIRAIDYIIEQARRA